MNFNFNKIKRSNIDEEYNYNDDPYGNNYSGTHILPRWKDDIIKKRRDEEIQKYKEIWSKDIEERNIKKLEEKRKKEELDILEEERIKKEIEEINKKEENEKQLQKEKENNIYIENEQLMKNKYKNRNKIIDNGSNDIIDEIKKKNLIKSESFNYNDSIIKLKNKYKDVDLNNIHFYKKNSKNENKKLLEKNIIIK
jgi:hypothetical protein